ncbi:hypothetical protein [Natrinema sp. H-ect4]|uniref:hypothetical protein n=1 Tax=Natrinema sp. H-ect4 TaxID=3242699 RepID=UPI0035A81E96
MSNTVLIASIIGGGIASASAIKGLERGRGWIGLLFIAAAAVTGGLVVGMGVLVFNPDISTFSICLQCPDESLFNTQPDTRFGEAVFSSIGASLGAGLTTYFFEPESQ